MGALRPLALFRTLCSYFFMAIPRRYSRGVTPGDQLLLCDSPKGGTPSSHSEIGHTSYVLETVAWTLIISMKAASFFFFFFERKLFLELYNADRQKSAAVYEPRVSASPRGNMVKCSLNENSGQEKIPRTTTATATTTATKKKPNNVHKRVFRKVKSHVSPSCRYMFLPKLLHSLWR